MSHMAEIDYERKQGYKIIRHVCHDDVERWVCTSCLASMPYTESDSSKLPHEAGCLNAPGASKTLTIIYPADVAPRQFCSDKFSEKREYPYDIPVGMSDEDACNDVYRQWNHVDGSEYISDMDIEERSFSVGDMIRFPDGRTVVCKGSGWKELTAAEVEKNLGMLFGERNLANLS